ncbi:hypothetical protein Acr_22g0007410 [Actinidia rufa]|uniref:CCHC-type domain-containing protein n=1 Tax=Actinidia rufa TaxID=165716 RepID=A0A7J0GKM0_9ERIC|nr:hypothetical protein Acr_22g0007410 [Actinidia rufa]
MVRGGVAARGREGGARMADLADVYDRDDATTEERFQLLEQRFEQLQETMLAQFAALQVGRQPHHHPRNHDSEEEEVSDGEPAIPFVDYPPRRQSNHRSGSSNWNTTNQVVTTQAVTAKPAGTQSKPSTSTSGFKCYKCGESGHRAAEWRPPGKEPVHRG